jgi:integrase/recombinase XerD
MEGVKTKLVNVVSVEDVFSSFVEDCKLRGLSEKTIIGYVSCLKIFLAYLDRVDVFPSQIDNDVLKGFLSYLRLERSAKHKTVKGYFSALSAFYDYLSYEGTVFSNKILLFRKRYLRRYKQDYDVSKRKLLSVSQMSELANFIMDPRDRALLVLLAKTGIRRGEMLRIDVEDFNWEEYSIMLKPTPKRSNRTVFFDDECGVVLRRWLRVREKLKPKTKALFISYNTLGRLSRNGSYNAVVKYAKKLGYHDTSSKRLEDHFGPHCCRHWFTTWLMRNGMKREYVKELRGDARREAIDIYHHIDKKELRLAYLACMPKLGI